MFVKFETPVGKPVYVNKEAVAVVNEDLYYGEYDENGDFEYADHQQAEGILTTCLKLAIGEDVFVKGTVEEAVSLLADGN